MKPLFIFSIPRAGSTLLQRIISSHLGVATAAEPWIILPLASLANASGVNTFSNYAYKDSMKACDELFDRIDPSGTRKIKLLSDFTRNIYKAAAVADGKTNATYFLDKTPRYYLIIDFIDQLFPDAKKIFLTRSVTATYMSIFNTWYNGRLRLNHHFLDVRYGPIHLHEGWIRHSDTSLLVSYENLTKEPAEELKKIATYLEIDFDGFDLERAVKTKIDGRMGDPIGQNKYKEIVRFTGRDTVNTYVKKWYLESIKKKMGSEVVSFCGGSTSVTVSNFSGLTKEIDDALGVFGSYIYRKFQFSFFSFLKNKYRDNDFPKIN